MVVTGINMEINFEEIYINLEEVQVQGIEDTLNSDVLENMRNLSFYSDTEYSLLKGSGKGYVRQNFINNRIQSTIGNVGDLVDLGKGTYGRGSRPFMLTKEAAMAFKLMDDAYFKDTGKRIRLNSSYRTLQEQIDIANETLAKKAKQGYYRRADGAICNKNGKVMVAAPKETAPHVRGIAIDVDLHDNDLHPWLLQNASTYGFYPYVVEAWHWNYKG